MRITGGVARGIPLKTPSGAETRPATDRTREAVFSSLGERVQDTTVLDIFAGTGAYGLEALSRGAVKVGFVENNRKVLAILKANCQSVQKALESGTRQRKISIQWLNGDAFKGALPYRADLVFMDPPYTLFRTRPADMEKIALSTLAPGERSRLILEHPGDWNPLNWPAVEIRKQLGKPKRDSPMVSILSWKASDSITGGHSVLS